MDTRCEDKHNRASRSTGARYRERVNTQSSGPVRSPSGKKKGTTTTAQTHSMFRHAGSRKQRKTNWLREKQSSNEPPALTERPIYQGLAKVRGFIRPKLTHKLPGGQPGELWPIRQPSSTCAGNGTSPSEQPTGDCTDRSWLVAQCLTDDSEPDSPDGDQGHSLGTT